MSERRTQEILQIRLDGAELWDVREYIADKQTAGDEAWVGATFTETEIRGLIDQADAMIVAAYPGEEPATAMHKAKLNSLYARAIQSCQIATARGILNDIAKLTKGEVKPDTQKARLLREIARRHKAVADTEPEPGEEAEWELAFEAGPLFKPSEWFPDCQGDDAARMHWTRRLADLVDDGLVVTMKVEGAKWQHVRLTEAGTKMIDTAA